MAGLDVLYHPHFEPSTGWIRSALLVYDSVRSIVPADSGYVPSDTMKRHLEKLPGTFVPTPPEPIDIVSEYWALRALKQAFEAISKQPKAQQIAASFKHGDWNTDDDDVLAIPGIVQVHGFKIAYVVYDELKRFGLVHGETDDGYFHVNEEAAYLIVSFLAQRMARRMAMRTVTDIDGSFLLATACDLIERCDKLDKRALLASSVLKFHIPENIGALSIEDFMEIRKRYESLRRSFPDYLKGLSELFLLDEVHETAELKNRIEDIVKQLNKDVEKIKNSRITRSIKRWLPIGIGGAISITAAAVGDTQISKLAAYAGVGIQILRESLSSSPIQGRLEGTQSLLVRAREEIVIAERMAESANRIMCSPYF